jgi:hypothetical protein
MGKVIGHTKPFGGILTQVLLDELPEEMDQSCLYIFIEEVKEAVFDIPQLGAHLFAVFEGEVGPVLQEPFEVVDRERTDAYVIFIGLGELSVEIISFQAELPEQLAFPDDLLDLFVALLVDITDLDGPFLYEVDLVMVICLKVDIFSLSNIDNMMLYFQVPVFFVGQVAPKVIVTYQEHAVITRHRGNHF